MAKTKKITGTSASYKAFLENLDLFAVGLESLSSRVDRASYSKIMVDHADEVVFEIKSRFGISEFDEDHFDVSATLSFETKAKGHEGLLLVEATFSAHFHPKHGSFDKEQAEQFASSEARLVFWPYFRQTVADVTSRMHIRPVTIPLTFKP